MKRFLAAEIEIGNHGTIVAVELDAIRQCRTMAIWVNYIGFVVLASTGAQFD